MQVTINRALPSNSEKCEMQEWLKEKQIQFDDSTVKSALYEEIKLRKPQLKSYESDKLAESKR